jgi:5'-3' exonuclease
MQVVLVDAKNAIHRYGWVGRQLTSESGQPTGAILGLLNCLTSFSRKLHNVKFIACWDGVNSRQSWRAKLFPAYKQDRINRVLTPQQVKDKKKMDLVWQMRKVKELFDLLGIVQIEDVDTEADDLVSIIAESVKTQNGKPLVYTNDHDYLQLLARGITVVSSSSQPPWGEKMIQAKFRCGKADVLKVRALLGDKSDGIPRAVPGVGEVAAAKYVAMGVDPALVKFAQLPQAVRLQAPRLEQHWETVHMNYRLMRLPKHCNDVEIPAEVGQRLTKEVRRVMKELHAPITRNRADYAKFLGILTEFGLLSSITNRNELWAVQN